MQQVSTIIHARWVIPIEPYNTFLEHHALVIEQGKIIDLLPSHQVAERYQSQDEHHLTQHVLMPGFINCHTHLPMNLLRGHADDLPLMTWLQQHIWPLEGKWVGPEFVAAGSRLAIAESIKGGVTNCNEMYFFSDETAKVAKQAGMRLTLGFALMDFPTAWAKDPDEYIAKANDQYQTWKDEELISLCWAPHAPYSVSKENFVKLQKQLQNMDIPMGIHLQETDKEITDIVAAHGQRPLAYFADLGLLSSRFIGVHFTNQNQDDIKQLAEYQAHIVHCPESNMKLASGFCPVDELLAAGVNVALGTDGAASNNDLDMIGEMRSACFLAKHVTNNPESLPAPTALSMATINGAKALGQDSFIGTLEKGKAADVIAINLDDISTHPTYNPISQVVYAASRHQVSDVWVAGRQLLQQRQLLTMDEQAIKAEADEWREKLLAV